MPPEQEELRAVGLMAAHEAEVARLYRTYAAMLPRHAELFQRLSDDEVGHAKTLASLVENARNGSIPVKSGRFTAREILKSLDRVAKLLKDAREGQISALAALTNALEIENSLIESRYFEVLDGDSPELKGLLCSMIADLGVHRETVRKAWELERKARP